MRKQRSEKANEGITRRKFLKDAGLVVGGVTVGSLGIVNACRTVTEQPNVVANNGTGAVTNNVTGNSSGSVAVAANTVNTTAPPPPVTKIAETTNPPAAVDLELFNPAGNQEITQFFSPRLSTLEGKTVAFLASDPTKWQPHRIFPVIMDGLKKLYPTIKFLPMDQFTVGLGISNDATIKTVVDKGANACIIGSAG